MKTTIIKLFGIIVRGPDNTKLIHKPDGSFISLEQYHDT